MSWRDFSSNESTNLATITFRFVGEDGNVLFVLE